MIKHGHIGAARAFHDLGFPPEQVKLAFIRQGVSEAEADYLVKEAWGTLAKGIGTKVLPWLSKTFGSKTLGAAGGTATKGLMQGGAAAKNVGGILHGAGQAAYNTLSGFAKSPFKSLTGEIMNFGRGMFFSEGKNLAGQSAPTVANYAGKGFGIKGIKDMVTGPGSTPMPTPM